MSRKKASAFCPDKGSRGTEQQEKLRSDLRVGLPTENVRNWKGQDFVLGSDLHEMLAV